MIIKELLLGHSDVNSLMGFFKNCMHIKPVDALIEIGVSSHDAAHDILHLINIVHFSCII